MLTAKQVAPLLGLSSRKVYELARAGSLPSFRFDDAVRFDPADVETYRTSCRSTGTNPTNAGASSSTASFKVAGTDFRDFCRKAGLKPKLTSTTGEKGRASPRLRMVSAHKIP